MLRNYYLILFIGIGLIYNTNAQVGIGTTSPMSTLDISTSDMNTPSNTDGILIPRINNFPTTNPTSHQNGMMVFLTRDVAGYLKGFHFWDHPNTRWVAVGTEEWKDGTNASGDHLIFASQAKVNGTDIVITDDGRVGIGTSDPVERFEFKGPGDNDFQITSANVNPPNFILYNTGGTLESPSALAANGEIGSFIVKTHDGNAIRENGGFRFYMDGVATPGSTPSRFIINTTPQGSTSQQQRISVRSNGNVGLSEPDPTATLHLRAGTATANSAPIKFTPGTLLSTSENGALEFDGSNLYFTGGSKREVILTGFKGTANIDFPNIGTNGQAESTINVPGASLGMACSCAPRQSIDAGLMWNCCVSASNQITIRVANVRTGNINPPNTAWTVTVTE